MSNEAKTLGADAIEFYDAEGKVSLNHAPLGALTFVPREGELVYLPADMTGSPSGYYEVKRVEYHYSPDSETDMPENIGPVKLARITVHVAKRKTIGA